MSDYDLITIEEEDETEDKLHNFTNSNKRIMYIWSLPGMLLIH